MIDAQAGRQTGPSDEQRSPRRLNLSERESAELIVGFSGAIGSGLDHVVEQTRELLKAAGYSIEYIKLSSYIEKFAREEGLLTNNVAIAVNSPDRFDTLQTAGNALRSKFSNHVLAKLAVSKIANHRSEQTPPNQDVRSTTPKKVAFLIDQLKHPAEVELLRQVYGNLFYLVGVFASEEQRRRNLTATLNPNDAQRAMDRDRRENEDHGQQLDKTLKLADLFVRNTDENRSSTRKQLQRFFELIHGAPVSTPSADEYAMYAAYAAALRSACMSRQVGAAITDAHGNLLSTGCNDVPKSNGGLYTLADTDRDWRCYNWKGGECWNDHHKRRIKNDVAAVLLTKEAQSILADAGLKRKLSDAECHRIATMIAKNTRLKDLIEFSRAVHAEMDAIISLARKGSFSSQGGKLFTTTFPCHNCARHIVAAGITTVHYIEPYEKSLALELHSDSIVGDPTDRDSNSARVRFLHFEGIAPRQYQRLFTPSEDRKDDTGKIRQWSWEKPKANPQYLDSYRELELRVVSDLESRGLSAATLSRIVT